VTVQPVWKVFFTGEEDDPCYAAEFFDDVEDCQNEGLYRLESASDELTLCATHKDRAKAEGLAA